ncbi:type I-C CRISPR-associated endonuclease Cas1c [Kyrpidia spormannii]|uniref:CRISPR-associated endonuclease Cas1 n=1 Tax=Kyrpidia spormannii TaxID=2055160 RepID=A0A6F9EH77_9BACL|nr:type I-C CRISPR-associated endonuclease Cas1c [Kyrpidia spormannii]CAB3395683.1 CRISPR-associated endonuclease Cas1 1 [Kyrpidia spormannii]
MIQEAMNTLYVQTEGAILRLDHDNVVVTWKGDQNRSSSPETGQERSLRIPLYHLQGIVVLGRVSLTSPLLARCAADGRSVAVLNSRGRFLYRIEGRQSGNVLLRVAQHRLFREPAKAVPIVQAILAGKMHNSRQVLLRAARDVSEETVRSELQQTAGEISRDLRRLPQVCDLDALRGMEGINAKRYFGQFSNLLRGDGTWRFTGRNRRPPRDPVNAVLSFLYSLLGNDCTSAVEAAGLDPQIGYLHALRPGRPALALDLMEELRPILADRTAITLINRRQLRQQDFDAVPGGAVLLNEGGRKTVLDAYQRRKQDACRHPLFKRPITFGMLPYLQARLLARAIRSDAVYVPFFYR